MVQTIVAILSLTFFALILFLAGYGFGRFSAKKKNAEIDTPQSTAASDGDSW